jgi:hypothetical protein
MLNVISSILSVSGSIPRIGRDRQERDLYA